MLDDPESPSTEKVPENLKNVTLSDFVIEI